MNALLYIATCAIAGAIGATIVFLVLASISPILGGAFVGYLVYKICSY